MPMTSRERVLRTVEFNRPDRIPRDIWALPVSRLENDPSLVDAFFKRWPTDFAGCYISIPAVSSLCCGDPYAVGVYRDEWGCEFVNIKQGVIGEVKSPPLADWSRLGSVRPPIEALAVDRDQVNAFCRGTDKFVLMGACARPFERLQFLRGSANLYMDIAEESADLRSLIDLVHGFYVAEMEAWAETDVDALSFMDDWGSQRGLLISPAQWRRLFKPLYADYVRIAREHGKKIFMHSDGHIESIYPDLVELGIDAINSQLFCMNIESLGAQFKGKITFWGEIDRQWILVNGCPEDARKAVRRVAESLYSPEGGVIAQFELTTGAKLEQADTVLETWDEVCRQ